MLPFYVFMLLFGWPCTASCVGRDSSVGIATRYGLNGPGTIRLQLRTLNHYTCVLPRSDVVRPGAA